MCILIKINPKNNHIIIQCENGHNNEMNIDSFISIYQIFKHSCDKCKQDLSKNFFYCTKCKELICNSCIKKCATCGKIVRKCLDCIDYFYEFCR